MYRLLQKHGKKIMAVLGAVLMITFALPSFRGSGVGGGRNALAGKMGGEKVLAIDVYRSQQAWELLSRIPINQQGQPVTQILGPDVAAQIKARPVLFLLLQLEARRMGVEVSQDVLNGAIANNPNFRTGNIDRDEDIKAALAELLLVRQAFVRAASAIKVSDPMIEHEMASMGQSITLDAADFTTAQYTAKVPSPSAEQLKAQFEAFADNLKGNTSDKDPFGFGYKYPDRVKLQYIAIPRTEVRKFIEGFSAPGKPKDPYEWEVEARKYYQLHQTDYPTTQPQASKSGSAFSLESATSRPTTRPYAEVRDQIRKKLIDEATDGKVAQIQERIVTTLATDYVAWHNAAGSATRPTTAPASSLGVPYDSVDYLQKLAAQIQSAYGVLPTIQSIATWQTLDDLSKQPGIGQAVVMGARNPVTAPLYIMGYTAAFMPPENRGETGTLQLMEPTRPLEDGSSTIYIARVSDVDPTHKPATLAEVEPQVRADLITKQAYELAKADATRLLEEARNSGLRTAAGSRTVIKVGPLTNQRNQTISGLPLLGQAADDFIQQAFKLVSTPTSRPSGKPQEMIELPRDGRVVVAELADVQALWTDRSKPLEEVQLSMMLKGELDQRFARQWFDYNAVVTRLSYVPEATGKDQETPIPPAQPMAPIF